MKYVLALDPSGNFYEGKGTTGWCIARDGYITQAGQIYSAEYASQFEYWHAVADLLVNNFCRVDLKNKDTFTVVCEDYRLYASKSEAQINSNLETPQLIGVIKWICGIWNVPCVLQMAAEVKTRWSDEVLFKTGLFKRKGRYTFLGDVKVEHHSKDAVRHCLHYMTFKEKTREPIQKKEKDRERSNY